MGKLFAVLLCLSAVAASQSQPIQKVPDRALSAKTIIARVHWPGASWRDEAEVKGEAEHFLKKWKKYQIVENIEQADLAVLVVVEPISVSPNFWSRLAWGFAQSQAGTHCASQAYDNGSATVNCYNTPAPAPLMPTTILSGSILLYDGADVRARHGDAEPIMVVFADNRGGKPLIGAGKRLRSLIDTAAKQETLK